MDTTNAVAALEAFGEWSALVDETPMNRGYLKLVLYGDTSGHVEVDGKYLFDFNDFDELLRAVQERMSK